MQVFRLLCLVSAFFTAFFGVVLLALGLRLLGFEVHASWLWVGAPLLIVGVVVVETWLVEALLGRRFGQRLSRMLLGLVSAAGVSAGVIPAGLAEVLPWRSVRSSGAKHPPRTASARAVDAAVSLGVNGCSAAHGAPAPSADTWNVDVTSAVGAPL